jgi:hypothetical protein
VACTLHRAHYYAQEDMEAFWEALKADVGTGPGSALPDGAQETGVAARAAATGARSIVPMCSCHA